MRFVLKVKEAVLEHLSKEPLAGIAIVFSLLFPALTYFHQIGMDKMQSENIRSQGEGLRISLSRNRMNDENGSNYITSPEMRTIETVWNVDVHNTSTQAPTTITEWNLYSKVKNKFERNTGSDFSSNAYSPFFKADGAPVNLPFTIAAGNSTKFKMKIHLFVTREAAERIYFWQNNKLSLANAEQSYSFETGEKGEPRDMFGNVGFDGSGFYLSTPQKEQDKLNFPLMKLEFKSSRGNEYSSTSSWYYMIYVFPDDKWAEAGDARAKRLTPH